MDTLASRGENIIYQSTPKKEIPSPKVYTGAGTQINLQKSGVPIVIGLLGVLLLIGVFK